MARGSRLPLLLVAVLLVCGLFSTAIASSRRDAAIARRGAADIQLNDPPNPPLLNNTVVTDTLVAHTPKCYSYQLGTSSQSDTPLLLTFQLNATSINVPLQLSISFRGRTVVKSDSSHLLAQFPSPPAATYTLCAQAEQAVGFHLRGVVTNLHWTPLSNNTVVTGRTARDLSFYAIDVDIGSPWALSFPGVELVIQLTTPSNGVLLFASTTSHVPSDTDFEYSGYGTYQTITIASPTPPYGHVYITVAGSGFFQYSLKAYLTPSPVLRLSDNVSITDSVRATEWDFYLFSITSAMYSPTSMLTLTLVRTSLTGDPDIYGRTYRLPSRDSYNVSNISPSPSVTLQVTSPIAAPWYFGVYGFSDANYTLIARYTPIPITQLVQDEFVRLENQTGFVYFEVPSSSPPSGSYELRIEMETLDGDPDIYVAYGFLPSRSRYDYSNSNSPRSGALDTVEVASPPLTNSWYVGIYSFTPTSSFRLRYQITPLGVTALSAGQTVSGTVASGALAVYSFDTAGQGGRLYAFQVLLHALSGDPDLYVSWGSPYGSWSDRDIGAGEWTDVSVINPNGTWYITISGFSSAQYELTVVPFTQPLATPACTLNNAPTVQLSRGTWRIYEIDVPSNRSLAIVLQASAGDPDLYLRRIEIPNLYLNDYSDTDSGTYKDVNLARITDSTQFYIGVYANGSSDAAFKLSACVDEVSVRPIGINQVVTGNVLADDWSVYEVQVDGAAYDILSVTVSPRGRDFDGYGPMVAVRYNALPDINQYDESMWQLGTLLLTNPQSGSYYIAIYGFTLTNYRLMASLRYSDDIVVALSSGVPTTGTATSGTWVFYSIYTTSSAWNVRMVASQGDPDIYVQYVDLPTLNHFLRRDVSSNSASHVAINDTAPTGFYYIGVYGYSNSTFTITANYVSNRAANAVAMSDTRMYADSVDSETWDDYVVQVPEGGASLLGINVNSGAVNLPVDVYMQRGSPPDIVPSLRVNQNPVLLENAQSGSYYVSVKHHASYTGPYSISSFFGAQGEIPIYSTGTYEGFVANNQVVSFQWNVDDVNSASELDVTVFTQQPFSANLLASYGKGNAPTRNSSDYVISGGSLALTVYYPPKGTWYFAVQGTAPLAYGNHQYFSMSVGLKTDASCPNACSLHGQCTANNRCSCSQGFQGDSCYESSTELVEGAKATGLVSDDFQLNVYYVTRANFGSHDISVSLNQTTPGSIGAIAVRGSCSAKPNSAADTSSWSSASVSSGSTTLVFTPQSKDETCWIAVVLASGSTASYATRVQFVAHSGMGVGGVLGILFAVFVVLGIGAAGGWYFYRRHQLTGGASRKPASYRTLLEDDDEDDEEPEEEEPNADEERPAARHESAFDDTASAFDALASRQPSQQQETKLFDL